MLAAASQYVHCALFHYHTPCGKTMLAFLLLHRERERERERERDFGPIWLCCLNNGLHYLNNITCISTIFFHPHIFPQHLNNVTKTTLPNGPFLSCSLQFSEQGRWEKTNFDFASGLPFSTRSEETIQW